MITQLFYVGLLLTDLMKHCRVQNAGAEADLKHSSCYTQIDNQKEPNLHISDSLFSSTKIITKRQKHFVSKFSD